MGPGVVGALDMCRSLCGSCQGIDPELYQTKLTRAIASVIASVRAHVAPVERRADFPNTLRLNPCGIAPLPHRAAFISSPRPSDGLPRASSGNVPHIKTQSCHAPCGPFSTVHLILTPSLFFLDLVCTVTATYTPLSGLGHSKDPPLLLLRKY